MAFDFTNTLNGIVYLTPTQFTTLSNKSGTVSGATQLFSDKIYILNDSLTTTNKNVLLTASAITNNFAHSAKINGNGFDIKDFDGSVLSTVNLSTISVAKAGLAYSVEWANITGKPTTFTPSTHTHTITQVTGLQDALDINYATFCDLRKDRGSQLLTGNYFKYNDDSEEIDYQNAITISGTLNQMTINFITGLRKPTIIHLIDYRGKHGKHGRRNSRSDAYYSDGRKRIKSKSYVFPRHAFYVISDAEYSAKTLTIDWTNNLFDSDSPKANWGNCLRTDDTFWSYSYHYYGVAFIYNESGRTDFPNGFTEMLKSSNLLNLI